MWYIGQNTNTAKVILPQLRLDVESRINRSAILLSSCLWVWVFNFLIFPRDLKPLLFLFGNGRKKTGWNSHRLEWTLSSATWWQSGGESNQGVYCKWRVPQRIVTHYISADLFSSFSTEFSRVYIGSKTVRLGWPIFMNTERIGYHFRNVLSFYL